jgi:hypothetical protein
VVWINASFPYGIVIGDLDWNGYVDEVDVGLFRICMGLSGPGVPARGRIGTVLEFGCGLADLDQDRDVDGVDFGMMQRLVGKPPTLQGLNGPATVRPAAATSSRPKE